MNPVELARGFVMDLWRIPIFFQLALLWMAGTAGWKWWNKQKQVEMLAASMAWPAYRARVVWAQVSDRKSRGEDGPSFWDGILTYSYTVPGHELEVGEHRKRFDDEEDAESWASGLRDTFVQVRVDPADAKRSIWQETAANLNPKRVDGALLNSSRPIDMEFGGAKNLGAWVVFCASDIGAVLALWVHVSSLMGRPAVTPERDGAAFFAMHIGAIVCGVASGMIAAKGKRVRGKHPFGASTRRFSVDTPLIKVISAYVTAVFVFAWVKMAAHDGGADRWGNVMFSSAWLLFYLSSALICWQQLRSATIVSVEDR